MKSNLSTKSFFVIFQTVRAILLFLCLPSVVFSQSASVDNAIIEYTTICKIEESKLLVERSYILQINNKNGDWLAEVSIPFREKEKVESLEAWITNSQGEVIRKLKKNDIVDRSEISDISLYEDDFVKTFDLKHNVYPYRVHYSYQQIYDEFISIDYWSPVIYNSTPTLKASLKLDLPVWYKVNILQQNIKEPTIDTIENRIFYEWNDSFTEQIIPETFSPPIEELLPKVNIVPESFIYGVPGNFTDWISFGNWQCSLNSDTKELPEAEKLIVKQLTANVPDTLEKIRILYHYLQDNTRYINVSIDVGGLKPYPASYVVINKYGDCKALSNYMQAMLSEAGIKSFYTKIYGDTNPIKINPEFVGPQFNHIVLFVPIGNDTIWLETTDRNNPFGYFGVFTQDRTAFAIIENESQLIKTPGLSLEEVKEEKHATIELGLGRSCKIEISECLRGSAFEKVNAIYTSYSEYEQKRIIPNYLIPFKSFELLEWEINKPGRDAPEIDLEYIVEVNNFVSEYDGSKIVPLLSSRLPVMEKPDKRKYSLRINYPINRQDSLVYKFDAGFYSEVRLPKEFSIESKFGKYEIKCNQFDDQVLIEKVYQLNSGSYGLEEYAEFYNFINRIKKQERKSSIILK